MTRPNSLSLFLSPSRLFSWLNSLNELTCPRSCKSQLFFFTSRLLLSLPAKVSRKTLPLGKGLLERASKRARKTPIEHCFSCSRGGSSCAQWLSQQHKACPSEAEAEVGPLWPPHSGHLKPVGQLAEKQLKLQEELRELSEWREVNWPL